MFRQMKTLHFAAPVVLCLLQLPTVSADVIHLKTGGKLKGDVLNKNETPRKSYIIKTQFGQVTLDARQVKSVVDENAALESYREFVKQTPKTVEGHLEIARRCKEAKLNEQRLNHFEEVLKLDPNNSTARKGLGFLKVNGVWIKHADEMRARGYVLYKGTWRIPQDVEAEINREKTKTRESEWNKNIRRWTQSIRRNRRQRAESLDSLKRINDPAAIPAMLKLLEDKKSPRELKEICLEVLSRMEATESVDALIKIYMEDPIAMMRERALDTLVKWKSRRALGYFESKLSDPDNKVVNHVATAIGSFGSEESVQPLMNALVTKHKFIQKGPGISAGFSPQGGSSLGAGGGTKVRILPMNNERVREALLAITPEGVDFGFDMLAWKHWYVTANTPKVVNLRRGE